MNTLSVSRLALALAFGVTLSACSSTPPDQIPSDQTAPGTASRPILSANEAKNFVAARYFASLTPNTAPWSPSPITLPAQPDFVVGRQVRQALRTPRFRPRSMRQWLNARTNASTLLLCRATIRAPCMFPPRREV